jgi:methanogen homocitrate synthase
MGEKQSSLMWIPCRYNFDDEVVKQFNLPEKVTFYDVTLRDGEQMPGVVFRKDEKVKLARALDELGIHNIEAGMPAVSQEDFDAVKEIANLGLSAKVRAFCRARKDDIDLALKCDVQGVLIEVPTSDYLIEYGYQWTKERVMNMSIEATSYAKAHGLYVAFFLIDSTRADPNYLKRIAVEVTEKAHVDALVVVDTFGCASPQGFAHLVRTVKNWVDVPIEVHCHNDLGLATANSLAGVTAGAEVVHTNVNGIGERAGGAATEEVAVALRIVYNVDTGLRYEKLFNISRMVEEMTKVKVSPGKPVVGERAFGYEAGIPVMFCRRLKAANLLKAGLGYLPEFVGNKFVVLLGKKSGSHSIEEALERLGIKADNQKINEILSKVKEASIKNKRAVTDNEFQAIVKEVLKFP